MRCQWRRICRDGLGCCWWGGLVGRALLVSAVCFLGWSTAASGQTDVAVEEEFWESVKDSNSATLLQSYIKKYPQGKYVGEARRKLEALKPPPATAPPEPVKPPTPTLVTVELRSKTPGVTFTPDQRFEAIPGKTVRVTASKEGYQPVKKDILIEARDMVVELDPLQRLQAPTSQPKPSPVAPSLNPLPGLAKTWRSPITGMEFVLIPAGTFQMGSNDSDANKNEKPVHTVRITKPFYLGKYEVTQDQWQAVMGTNLSNFTGDPNRPVENVSWEDVQEFIRRLNSREGRTIYRLPTEAEWEHAARAGTTTRWSFGDDASQLGRYAWYGDKAAGPRYPVGQLQPNHWGLYDMHGNVLEWGQDWSGSYASGTTDDPPGPPRALTAWFGAAPATPPAPAGRRIASAARPTIAPAFSVSAS
jgi:formylglycine-generating enzyme required for sulfatase activity